MESNKDLYYQLDANGNPYLAEGPNISVGDIIDCDYAKFYTHTDSRKVSRFKIRYQITKVGRTPLKWASRKSSIGSEDYYYSISEIENKAAGVEYVGVSTETYYIVWGKVIEIDRPCYSINYENLMLFIDIDSKQLHYIKF